MNSFDFFVSQNKPFKVLYLKNTIQTTIKQAEIICSLLSTVLVKGNLCITFDYTTNRQNNKTQINHQNRGF
jgi:DNA-binding transcriptional regulator WhiA